MLKGSHLILQTIREALQETDTWTSGQIGVIVEYLCEHHGWKLLAILQMLGVTLTGAIPEENLWELMERLGKQEVLDRINQAVQHRRRLKRIEHGKPPF